LNDAKVSGEPQVSSKAVTISAANVDDIEAQLLVSQPKIYAVLDSVDEPEVPERVVEWGERCTNLYIGAAERDYWAISPYLLWMQGNDLDWILTNLQPDSWGILAESGEDLKSLKRHFRRFLTVKEGNSGRSLLFRFYDPRVLPVFLESCSAEQARAFFGPIRTFYFFTDPDTAWQATLSEAS
jgi:hypothetical protein